MGGRLRMAFYLWYWEGYDEALILYVLSLGSPIFPIPETSYTEWLTTYEWKTIYDIECLYAGPLFIHQLSHVWIDFRAIRDPFMREHDCDYFENSRRAAYIQQQYATRNPMGFAQYGEFCWGTTASDGPGRLAKNVKGVERRFFDYLARAIWSGRRHTGTVVGRGLASICAGNCLANDRSLQSAATS
jgi:hypothetical protein